jgi:hypothetical protein
MHAGGIVSLRPSDAPFCSPKASLENMTLAMNIDLYTSCTWRSTRLPSDYLRIRHAGHKVFFVLQKNTHLRLRVCGEVKCLVYSVGQFLLCIVSAIQPCHERPQLLGIIEAPASPPTLLHKQLRAACTLH